MHAQFHNPMDYNPQAPLSMGFPRQEDWSGLPRPLPGDLPNPETESVSLVSLFWQVNFFTTTQPGKPPRHPAPNVYLMYVISLCFLDNQYPNTNSF